MGYSDIVPNSEILTRTEIREKMNTDDYPLLFQFKQHLKVLNRSPQTINNYCKQIEAFRKSTDIDIKAVDRNTIENYVSSLYDWRNDQGEPYKPATISVKIRAIKRFFEFLTCTNEIFIDPTEFIKEPKRVKGLPKAILNLKEAKLILDQPNLGTLRGIRDRTILELFYSTGIRLDELIRLTVYDIDMEGKLLRINKGKGAKDRVVPLGKHAIRFLREYINKVRTKYTKHNRRQRLLLVNYHGNPLSGVVVSIMIRKCVTEANIKKKVSAHTFRHTFATELIKNGADITAVQKMMGHANLRTTQDYIKRAGVDIKKIHHKTHPREQDKATDIKSKITRKKPKYERKQNH